jgi:hypothetical protein
VTVSQKDRVLIVGEDFVRRNRWASWLRQAGFDTATCPGPTVTAACPRLGGTSCALREWADLALIEVEGPQACDVFGTWPEPIGTKDPHDVTTVLMRGPQGRRPQSSGSPVSDTD